MSAAVFPGFESLDVDTGETSIFVRWRGTGPPLLLLHGFPETHLMWRDIAPKLARDFTVVCADLRGYGRSGCPPSDAEHGPYTKRAMARDMVHVMTGSATRAFRSPVMIAAAASPIAWRSIIPNAYNGWPCLTC